MWGKILDNLVFLLIPLTFQTIFANQQPNRIVSLEKIEHLVPCRPDLAICDLTLDPSPSNSLAKAINLNMTILHRVLAENFHVKASVFRLGEHENKHPIITYKRNLCDFLEHDLKVLVNFDTNPVFEDFQLTCPYLEPKSFFIRNFTMDSSNTNTGIALYLQMLPLWTVKLVLTIGGCPHSELYNNSTWTEEGENLCYRAAIIASISEE